MRRELYLCLFRAWLTDRHPKGHPVEAFLWHSAMALRPSRNSSAFLHMKGR
jgi:hypothetical protein